MHKSTVFIFAGALAGALTLQAQKPYSTPASRADAATTMGDVNQQAAALVNTTNNGEIATAKLIEDRTQNSKVRDLAKELMDDHQNAENKLRDLAQKQNLTLQTDPTVQKQNETMDNKLATLSPPMADRTYVNDEVKDHRQAIRQLQELEPKITDPELKSYVDSVIPVLQKHLDAAEKVRGELGNGS